MKSHRRLIGLVVMLLITMLSALTISQISGCPSRSAFAASTEEQLATTKETPVIDNTNQPPMTEETRSALRDEVEKLTATPEQETEVAEVPAPELPPIDVPAAAEPISPAFTMMYWTILGLHPEWRPDACDHPFVEESTKVVCERVRDRGQKWAGQIAFYILTEAVRQGVCQPSDALCFLWFAGQGQRESGLSQGDICKVVLPVAWVEEVPADAQLNERVRMCWHRGASAGRNCQKVYLRTHSDREYVVDRCAYGEVGIFQVRSHEARSGQIVPATGERLPGPWAERRTLLLDPWKNISLAFVAFREGRDYCCGVGDVADEKCLSRVDAWLFVYNTGLCKGTQGIHYIDKIGRAIVKAMKYVCRVLPTMDLGEFDVCNREDVANFFTPPGRPRRHRVASQERIPSTTPD